MICPVLVDGLGQGLGQPSVTVSVGMNGIAFFRPGRKYFTDNFFFVGNIEFCCQVSVEIRRAQDKAGPWNSEQEYLRSMSAAHCNHLPQVNGRNFRVNMSQDVVSSMAEDDQLRLVSVQKRR